MMTLTFITLWFAWARRMLDHPIEIDLDRAELDHWLFDREQRRDHSQ